MLILPPAPVKVSTGNWPPLPTALTTAPRTKLRRHFRQLRRQLSPVCRHRHALALVRQVRCSGLLLCHRRVGLYLANSAEGEQDPGPLQLLLEQLGIMTALPVVKQNELHFYAYRSGQPLLPNRFGIGEPAMDMAPPIALLSLDLVFVPLVAVDQQGYRLGMGGGFYDRSFSLGHPQRRRPLLVGLAHELQRVAALPHEAWDVPLDALITEAGRYAFSRRGQRFGEMPVPTQVTTGGG